MDKIDKVKIKGDLGKGLTVLKEAKQWAYNNIELNTIQNRFFIMSEIETDTLKKLSLRNLYNALKDFNETYGEKINESYK